MFTPLLVLSVLFLGFRHGFDLDHIAAISDIVSKSLSFTAIDMGAFRGRFSYLLLESWDYALLRYLRRFILYFTAVALFYFASRKIFSKENT